MIDIRPLDADFAVAPQIDPADIPALAGRGFRAIVNNRPDGEQDGQPTGDAIAEAARAAGLAYTAIPVTQAGFSAPQLDALAQAIVQADGPILAFCRSGTRSANLWALARARAGDAPDDLIGKGAAAGYDLNGLRPLLDQLRGAGAP